MSARDAWVHAFPLADLEVGAARLFARDHHRVAVFRTGPEQAYAVDNRCPHEGYPLVRGHVKECVVTCIWHNFKFDLRDGRCLIGDEHVRSYPLRIVDGRIELDLADPDPGEEVARLLASLQRGAFERKLGQIARDLVRLLQLGAPPAELAAAAARFDAEHTDYGTTHALPVACDVLALAPDYPGVEAALPLLQPFDLASESHLRRPARVAAAAVDPGDDPARTGARLRDAVEAEDLALAEGLTRGAIARGWGREVLEPWLYRVCADHFLDFGHALIYQVKIFDLLAAIGWRHADPILPAHVLRIVNATREEQVPEWKWLRDALDVHAARLPAWFVANDHGARARAADLEDALVAGERDAILAALTQGLGAGLGLRGLAEALVLGGAERLLRFDPAHDADPTCQDGWLDVTHRFTFAAALDLARERYHAPELLRLYFFAAAFVQRARPLDLPDPRRPPPASVPADPQRAAEAVLAAIRGRDAEAAEALAAGHLAAHPTEPLRHALLDATLRDPATRPIFVAHLIKTGVAAFAARERLRGHPRADLPVLAYVRYFASPARERPLERLAHEAIGFVVHGKVPRVLS